MTIIISLHMLIIYGFLFLIIKQNKEQITLLKGIYRNTKYPTPASITQSVDKPVSFNLGDKNAEPKPKSKQRPSSKTSSESS